MSTTIIVDKVEKKETDKSQLNIRSLLVPICSGWLAQFFMIIVEWCFAIFCGRLLLAKVPGLKSYNSYVVMIVLDLAFGLLHLIPFFQFFKIFLFALYTYDLLRERTKESFKSFDTWGGCFLIYPIATYIIITSCIILLIMAYVFIGLYFVPWVGEILAALTQNFDLFGPLATEYNNLYVALSKN